MQIIQDTTEFHLEDASAAAIGKFDGIHRGHEMLLSCILEQKRMGLIAVVFTFHPSASVYFGQAQGGELTTREEKRSRFEKLGVDVLIEFPLNKSTAAISPEDFVRDILVKKMNTKFIAAGMDLSFGRGGKGDSRLLEEMSGELGFQVTIIDKVFYKEREISSTYVREMVEQGNMQEAGALLGRYYSFEGTVERGNRLGRRLGMPTMNLYPRPEKLLPPWGVYYSRLLYEGGVYPGITNIGRKPTVNDTKTVSVETYLYDFDRDMYGKDIVTELLAFKRPEQKFESVVELKAQMERDIEEGKLYWKNFSSENCYKSLTD
ncbi:MAG: bifunctional riboflavin kinase/FAD synthetase [Lachnospiraceae bacterium]|nr:bifunctional riboflavin kinase/FAD synthetase [Lachnospiraceae bacterium]